MFFSDWVGGSPLTAASCDVAGLVPAAIRYRGIYSFHWSPGGSPLMRQNQNIHCILSSLLFLQHTRGAGHHPPLGDNYSSKDLYVVGGWDAHLGDGQCRGPSGGKAYFYFYFSSPTFSYLTIMASSKLVRNSDSELHMCTLLLLAVHL